MLLGVNHDRENNKELKCKVIKLTSISYIMILIQGQRHKNKDILFDNIPNFFYTIAKDRKTSS